MCNRSYEHEHYTVGTPWCDVDSSGSWRGGRAGCPFSQSEGRNKEGTGEGGRASERTRESTFGRKGRRQGARISDEECSVCKKVSTPSCTPLLARDSLPEINLGPNPLTTGSPFAGAALVSSDCMSDTSPPNSVILINWWFNVKISFYSQLKFRDWSRQGLINVSGRCGVQCLYLRQYLAAKQWNRVRRDETDSCWQPVCNNRVLSCATAQENSHFITDAHQALALGLCVLHAEEAIPFSILKGVLISSETMIVCLPGCLRARGCGLPG